MSVNNDTQNNLNLDSLLAEESQLKDEIMKAVAALDNAKQKLKSLQVQIELHTTNLTSITNKKGNLLQQQWQILNQQEQKSRERTKEKMQLLVMEDQNKIRIEILENKKTVVQENIDCKNQQEYLGNMFNEIIFKRKEYEKQLYDLEQEVAKNDEKLRKMSNNCNKWTIEKH